MDLAVQQIDARVYDALGIISRAGFRPRLQEGVSIVVSVPLNVSSAGALGFNDAETDALAAFAGSNVQTADVGNLRAAQIMNPTGSGEVVYVDVIEFATTNASEPVHMGFYNTPLTSTTPMILKYGGAAGTVATQLRTAAVAASLGTALRYASFNVVSVMTGTGFTSTDYGAWGGLAIAVGELTIDGSAVQARILALA